MLEVDQLDGLFVPCLEKAQLPRPDHTPPGGDPCHILVCGHRDDPLAPRCGGCEVCSPSGSLRRVCLNRRWLPPDGIGCRCSHTNTIGMRRPWSLGRRRHQPHPEDEQDADEDKTDDTCLVFHGTDNSEWSNLKRGHIHRGETDGSGRCASTPSKLREVRHTCSRRQSYRLSKSGYNDRYLQEEGAREETGSRGPVQR